MGIRYFLFFIMLFAVGCDSSRPSMGKFSEEEMAKFPLTSEQGLPAIHGGLVLSIGSETITVDQIVSPLMRMLDEEVGAGDYSQFRQQVGSTVGQLLRSKIDDILLYEEAKRSAPESVDEFLDKAVETEVNRFVADYDGNIASAQKAIEAKGFNNWQEFRDYHKKLILTQNYIQQKISGEVPVTHGELLDYYNAHKAGRFEWEGSVEFSLIDLPVEKVEPFGKIGPAEAAIIADKAAIERASGLIKRIRQGEDFGEIAKKHSQGRRASVGGKWSAVTLNTLATPYDVLDLFFPVMEPGEISDPIQGKGRVFIMKLEGKIHSGYKSFEEVQGEVESEVSMIRRNQQRMEMASKLISEANISNLDEFLDYCIETAYRRKLSGQ